MAELMQVAGKWGSALALVALLVLWPLALSPGRAGRVWSWVFFGTFVLSMASFLLTFTGIGLAAQEISRGAK